MSSPGNDSPANKKPTSAEPVPDRSTADVGIVCTHKGELKAFLKRVDRQRSYTEKKITVRGGFLGETIRLAIAEAGEGYASHRAATELLITYIYKAAFTLTQFDYAGALTVVMFVLFLGIALLGNLLAGGEAGKVDMSE